MCGNGTNWELQLKSQLQVAIAVVVEEWTNLYFHLLYGHKFQSGDRQFMDTTLKIPISEGSINSSHTHNLAKSQSYRGAEVGIEWHQTHDFNKFYAHLS